MGLRTSARNIRHRVWPLSRVVARYRKRIIVGCALQDDHKAEELLDRRWAWSISHWAWYEDP